MKKILLKSTIAVVAVAASSLGAWRAYNAYGVTDNTLLVENIEALSNPSDPGDTQISNKAIEYVYGSEYKPTGFRADVSIDINLMNALKKMIGVSYKGKAIDSKVKTYMTYTALPIYQKNCIEFDGSNCVCDPAQNGKWIGKPNPTPSWWGKESKKCN